jgi:peroxiredoxin
MKNSRLATVRRTTLLMLVAALLAVVGCSDGNGTTSEPPASPEDIGLMEVQVRAPDFTLATTDGSQLTLADLQGQLVLLNFWQLDCPPCKEEMPYLDAAGKAFAGTAHVVVINIQDSESEVQEYFGDSELNMFVPLDVTGFVASQYSIGFTPTTFLIDSEGVIRYAKVGPFTNYNEIAAAIEFTRLKDAE